MKRRETNMAGPVRLRTFGAALLCVLLLPLFACENVLGKTPADPQDTGGDTGQGNSPTTGVAGITVTGITLDSDVLSGLIGETKVLTAAVSPDNAEDKTVTWSSGDADIVSVDGGVLSFLSLGTTVITAAAGDKTAQCAVTVEADYTVRSWEELSGAFLTIKDDSKKTRYAIVVADNITTSGGSGTTTFIPATDQKFSGKTIILSTAPEDGAGKSITVHRRGSLFEIGEKTKPQNDAERFTLVLGGELTLDGDSKNTTTGILIQVNAAGALELRDNATVTNANGTGIKLTNGGVFTMSGGTVSGFKTGVWAEGAFTMSGGEIRENKLGLRSGGQFIMTMTGGSIHDNDNSDDEYYPAGGVYVGWQTTFEMRGGSIYNNTGRVGGGVSVYGATNVFKLLGGEIYNNTVTKYGGGVYVYQDATAVIEGGRIWGNTAGEYGGGLCLDEGYANSVNVHFWFTKTGGHIEGYSAADTRSNKVVYLDSPATDRGAAICVLTNSGTGDSGTRTVIKTRETAVLPALQLYAQCAGNNGSEVWTFYNDVIPNNWGN
jgi:hypothetical protein